MYAYNSIFPLAGFERTKPDMWIDLTDGEIGEHWILGGAPCKEVNKVMFERFVHSDKGIIDRVRVHLHFSGIGHKDAVKTTMNAEIYQEGLKLLVREWKKYQREQE